MPKTKSYAVRLTEVQKNELTSTSKKVGLNFSDTLRKSADLGRPILEKALGKKPQ